MPKNPKTQSTQRTAAEGAEIDFAGFAIPLRTLRFRAFDRKDRQDGGKVAKKTRAFPIGDFSSLRLRSLITDPVDFLPDILVR